MRVRPPADRDTGSSREGAGSWVVGGAVMEPEEARKGGGGAQPSAQGKGTPGRGLHRGICGKGQRTKRDKGGGPGKGSGQEHRLGGQTDKEGHYKRRPR